MKRMRGICVIAALLAASATVYAQDANAPAHGGMQMHCPMMADTSGMQKDMDGMLSELQSMMKGEKDPAMRQRLRKMHDRMSDMQAGVRKMGMGAMMGAPQPAGANPGHPAASKPKPSASPDDHSAHHPIPTHATQPPLSRHLWAFPHQLDHHMIDRARYGRCVMRPPWCANSARS